jgi:hypothetical protein
VPGSSSPSSQKARRRSAARSIRPILSSSSRKAL